jgi:hypothetical protein
MVSEKKGPPGCCYRTKKFKLIYWMGYAPIEFYDLDQIDEKTLENLNALGYIK